MTRQPLHPIERPTFRLLMLGSLLLGVVLLLLRPPMDSPWSILMALSFAVFLITFGVGLIAWVLREHELWREGRRAKGGLDRIPHQTGDRN
jgi:hypothetical protein